MTVNNLNSFRLFGITLLEFYTTRENINNVLSINKNQWI